MTTRKYSSRAQQTTLTSPITSGDVAMTVGSGANLMGGKTPAVGETYTVVIDPDTALEEIVDVSNHASGNTLTIARGIDGSTAVAHSAGAIVRHMVIGRDLQEANTHIENTTTAHGITLANIVQTGTTGTVTSGMILDGTILNADINASAAIDKTKISGTAVTVTDTGTVTSTMIADGTILNADVNASAAIAYSKLALAGTITSADITNDTIVNADINTAAAISLSKLATDPLARANHTGTQLAATVSNFDTQVRTNRLDQMAAPTAAVALNAQKLTGVADPTVAQDASTKAYVDAQITALVGGAPGTLDTLDEIAAAINDSGSFATSVVLRDGTQSMTGALAMGTNKITGVGDPTAAQDVATKNYIDTAIVAPSNLTGPITSVGSTTSIASQTGTGTKFVVDTSPTIITPTLSGATVAGTINGTTIPSTKTLVVTTDNLSVLAATTSAQLAGVISDETGSGALVFGTSPTLTTPVIVSAEERLSISATAATGTVNFDANTQGILYYTSNASGNWILNVRGASGTTLNSVLATGDAITIAFLVTNGTTAYYPTALHVDSVAQTVKYANGQTPAYGNASAIDAYQYTIIKTASATFTVLGAGPIEYA